MQIEYVTHASLLVRAGNFKLLTDTLSFYDSFVGSFMCHFPLRNLRPAGFGTIDSSYGSHIHPVHGHAKTVKKLKDSIRQVILAGEPPYLKVRFRALGFKGIRLSENGKSRCLEDELEVTRYWSDPIDMEHLLT